MIATMEQTKQNETDKIVKCWGCGVNLDVTPLWDRTGKKLTGQYCGQGFPTVFGSHVRICSTCNDKLTRTSYDNFGYKAEKLASENGPETVMVFQELSKKKEPGIELADKREMVEFAALLCDWMSTVANFYHQSNWRSEKAGSRYGRINLKFMPIKIDVKEFTYRFESGATITLRASFDEFKTWNEVVDARKRIFRAARKLLARSASALKELSGIEAGCE